MGLGFVGSRAHWSYSGFSHFRKRLAMACGFSLDSMEGFTEGGRPWKEPWIGTAGDLVYLLNHSDCDGTIGPVECGLIAKKLREVLHSKEFALWGYPGDYDLQQGLMFAEDMENCCAKGITLQFC